MTSDSEKATNVISGSDRSFISLSESIASQTSVRYVSEDLTSPDSQLRHVTISRDEPSLTCDFMAHFHLIDRPEVVAALLYLWAIISGVSEAALDRLLKLLAVVQPKHCWPQSIKSSKTLIRKYFAAEKPSVISLFACDLCLHEQCIVETHHNRYHIIVATLCKQVYLLVTSKISEMF